MAFTYDPTTNRGRVRLLVSDTDEDTPKNQIFTDAEIDAFLSLENNEIYMAAAQACRSIAASASKSAIAYRAVGQDVDLKSIPEHFRELAREYKERAMEGEPAEHIDSFDHVIGRWGQDGSEYVGDPV